MIKKGWVKYEPETPLCDQSVARYEKWTDDGWEYEGMRHKETGKAHGPVLKYADEEYIWGGSQKDGKWHGFVCRWTEDPKI